MHFEYWGAERRVGPPSSKCCDKCERVERGAQRAKEPSLNPQIVRRKRNEAKRVADKAGDQQRRVADLPEPLAGFAF